MSDLRPVGVPITLDGTERHFLFTLNAIDEVQSHYDTDVLNALDNLFDEKKKMEALRFFTSTLLNDEYQREKWKKPDTELKEVSVQQAGWIINVDNIADVTAAILEAYRISLPDQEDEDPNQTSGQQSK